MAGEITGPGLAILSHLPWVQRIDLDEGGSGSLAESVPLIRADLVQAQGFSGAGVTVAVLDSGLDSDHPDLVDDLVGEACFCSGGGGCCPDGSPSQIGVGAAEDDHGHGSNVAGIVTSAGILSPPGTAPDASIVAVKVLDSQNSFCCSSDVIAGLDWILTNRPDVKVVNMSLATNALFPGICDNATAFTQAFAAVLNALKAAGVATFAASGNNGSTTSMAAPACVDAAVSVAAVWDAPVGKQTVLGCMEEETSADQVACFSNTDSVTDLLAPGAPITSAYLAGGLSIFSGTSQAAPHAAGCAADLISAVPFITPGALVSTLKATGTLITDARNGVVLPRVDCAAALASLDCMDVDGDGFGSPGSAGCPGGLLMDCDDGNVTIFPGAGQICDGVNNDCLDPTWPALPPGEVDADGDGISSCAGDCDDTDPGVWALPGEVRSVSISHDFGSPSVTIGWQPPLNSGATVVLYDTLSSQSAGVFGTPAVCVESDDGSDTLAADTVLLEASQIGFYLIRAQNGCGDGVLGLDGSGQQRLPGRPCPGL